jgi:mannosylglycerate hydrolase
MPSSRYNLKMELSGIPSFGYKTYKVTPLYDVRGKNPKSMLVAAQTMENEFIRVSINSNGTLDVTEKGSGREYGGIGFFKDTGEIGNPWEHISPENDRVYTTLNENAVITLLYDGEMECSFQVDIGWSLPVSRSADEKSRSGYMTPINITNIITLRKGQRYVEFTTKLDNTAEDHYLQVAFPSNIKATHVAAQGQFDVVTRPIEKYDYSKYDEIPMTEAPMNSFVDLSDGTNGIALLNTGLKAYEADDDPGNTLYLTLLRSFPLRICVTQEMQDYSKLEKGSQCLGKHSFRYAFMPHSGDWEAANIWQESEKFNLELTAAQMTPNKNGKCPLEKSFIELKTENLNVSAVKQSEDGAGWVLRLFNPSDKAVKNAVRVNGGLAAAGEIQSPIERQSVDFRLPGFNSSVWKSVNLATLEEIPGEEMAIGADGWVDFEITGKKIITLLFK